MNTYFCVHVHYVCKMRYDCDGFGGISRFERLVGPRIPKRSMRGLINIDSVK